MIRRTLLDQLKKQISSNKIITLIGARQVGKSTLLKTLQKELHRPSNWLNADEPDVLVDFENAKTSTELIQLIGENNEIVFIDEAQRNTAYWIEVEINI